MSGLSHLDELEAEAIYIIREVAAECEKPVMLYSIGKDSSVMLHLAMKAFYPEKPPFPFLHIDTTWKFREMIEFRDRIAKENGIEMLVYTNQEGVDAGINPFDHGSAYTDIMKTQALKQALKKYEFTAALAAAAVTRKNPVRKRESSPSVTRRRHGTRKTRDRRCGNCITPRSIKARASVYSRSQTGQKKISGSTSNVRTLRSYRFILQKSVRSYTETATSLWWMMTASNSVRVRSRR